MFIWKTEKGCKRQDLMARVHKTGYDGQGVYMRTQLAVLRCWHLSEGSMGHGLFYSSRRSGLSERIPSTRRRAGAVRDGPPVLD